MARARPICSRRSRCWSPGAACAVPPMRELTRREGRARLGGRRRHSSAGGRGSARHRLAARAERQRAKRQAAQVDHRRHRAEERRQPCRACARALADPGHGPAVRRARLATAAASSTASSPPAIPHMRAASLPSRRRCASAIYCLTSQRPDRALAFGSRSADGGRPRAIAAARLSAVEALQANIT